MCKKRIEKASIKTKGVKSAVWNLETHQLRVIYDEQKVDIETIKSNISATGHDTKTIKASNEAYDRLFKCVAIPILVSRSVKDYKNIASDINECS